MGERVIVRVRLLAENLDECESKLIFDDAVFDDISNEPNPRQLGSGNIAGEVLWRIRAKRKSLPTSLVIEGRANGLFQKIEFFAGVLP